MGITGGHWVRTEGETVEGLHRCNTPMILADKGIFAPKAGAVWQCDCGNQWEIHRKSGSTDMPGGMQSSLLWERRADSIPDRGTVITRLALVVDDLETASPVQVLAGLERLKLARWTTR